MRVGAGGITKTLYLGLSNCIYDFKNIFLLYINAYTVALKIRMENARMSLHSQNNFKTQK